ncbi:MAG: phosphate-starvation-inducible PsiE family protein [Deltaproteobacteria bacterium]|nr:phosphate-starvation-inducible PsiE family protein [Deltaproteobacteria bacterium]
MHTIERIKAHYRFTEQDARLLSGLKPIMEKYRDNFVAEFYSFVKEFEDAHKFLKDDATIRRHQEALKIWFINLFSGHYGHHYLAELEKVGMAHVRINLHAHYVNAAFHFVKLYCQDVLRREIIDADERTHLEHAVEKILDINLDVFTSSYIEEEKKFFLSQKVESKLIQLANRFSHGLNLILVLGLVLLGFMVMGLFAYDVTHILDSGDLEKGLLSTLGSLLMLWVVIELMDTEIKHLKGGKFAIKVFISVALVAVIRKILVASLKHDAGAFEAQLALIAAVAVLGAVYWLVSKVDS